MPLPLPTPADDHAIAAPIAAPTRLLFARRGWLRSRIDALWFEFRANGLRLQRGLKNVGARLTAGDLGARRSDRLHTDDKNGTVCAESITPLWSTLADDDSSLVAGKVQNLRIAAARLDGLSVAAGETFSFWGAVGRPSAARGFVQGRELREGCMIATIGGGLCQLSNALYATALDAGFGIVERHPHSLVVPGSTAAIGRDATVFWNYIDLRFRADHEFVIDARLTRDQLVVRLRRHVQSPTALPAASAGDPLALLLIDTGTEPDDCMRCDQHDCVQHIEPSPRAGRCALLLDQQWPEFDRWLSTQPRNGSIAMVPIDGVRRQRPQYAWQSIVAPQVRVIEHRWLTLKRSLASRWGEAQGPRRQTRLLALDAAFAQAYARALNTDVDELVVPIGLLAALERIGALGGRRVSALMTRAPLAMLHRDLDRAAALHPQSTTLADFRADALTLHLEQQALQQADRLITPHTAVAAFLRAHYPAEVVQLDWVIAAAPAKPVARGLQLLFPASALGRKGAFELREACRATAMPLRVLGTANEWNGFWDGVRVAPANPRDVFDDIGCVVLPAFVEHRPGILLRAIAAGIAVIASENCGLSEAIEGVTVVPSGDTPALIAALLRVMR